VLHQLNNIFASVHSSLDLALAHHGQPQAQAYLVQAQASAKQGALLVNELRLESKEPAARGPLRPAQELNPKGFADELRAVQPTSLEGSERILVVEDDESVRLLLRAVLMYRGYQVTEACDGEEAVRFFRQKGPFDLIILDQAMPKLDGRAALEQIRAVDAGVLALGLSGLPPEASQDARPVAPCGLDAQLSKPFDNTELLAFVRRLLDRRAPRPGQSAP
jgi:CheY-like chemotaxis protein